jgi:hypothetical protein
MTERSVLFIYPPYTDSFDEALRTQPYGVNLSFSGPVYGVQYESHRPQFLGLAFDL